MLGKHCSDRRRVGWRRCHYWRGTLPRLPTGRPAGRLPCLWRLGSLSEGASRFGTAAGAHGAFDASFGASPASRPRNAGLCDKTKTVRTFAGNPRRCSVALRSCGERAGLGLEIVDRVSAVWAGAPPLRLLQCKTTATRYRIRYTEGREISQCYINY